MECRGSVTKGYYRFLTVTGGYYWLLGPVLRWAETGVSVGRSEKTRFSVLPVIRWERYSPHALYFLQFLQRVPLLYRESKSGIPAF